MHSIIVIFSVNLFVVVSVAESTMFLLPYAINLSLSSLVLLYFENTRIFQKYIAIKRSKNLRLLISFFILVYRH